MIINNNLNDNVALNFILEDQNATNDIIQCVVGKYVGTGSSRSVYDCQLYDNCVVKIETGNTFHNMMEYAVWEEVKGLCGDLAWVKEWFAPIRWISPNGKILIMEKPHPNTKGDRDQKEYRIGYGTLRWIILGG